MGHHFDSPASRADSRINITDNYLFPATEPGKVVAIMAVSPLAGIPSPYHSEPQYQTFRPETAYELRFDTDNDYKVDRLFRFVFSGETSPQEWVLTYLSGAEAQDTSAEGRELGRGRSGETTTVPELGRVWIGLAGDPFWLDAVAARGFIDKTLAAQVWQPNEFSTGNITTGATNVIAIVVELPLAFISSSKFNYFTTVSANDHHSWTQVNRCGRPNFAATFVDNPELSTRYNDTSPDTDLANFGGVVAELVAKLVKIAGTHPDPEGYGQNAAHALLPDVIPYDPKLSASFGFAGINGRGLSDDFGAVVYSTVFNYPIRTALPALPDLRSEWPYLPPARPLPDALVSVPSRNEA